MISFLTDFRIGESSQFECFCFVIACMLRNFKFFFLERTHLRSAPIQIWRLYNSSKLQDEGGLLIFKYIPLTDYNKTCQIDVTKPVQVEPILKSVFLNKS